MFHGSLSIDYHNQLNHFVHSNEIVDSVDILEDSETSPIFPNEEEYLMVDEFDDDSDITENEE